MTATTTEVDPRQQLAELEQRIVDGDTTVTAAALQKARAAVDLADLAAIGAAERACADQAERRQDAEDALRADLDSAAGRLGDMQDAFAALVTALRTFTGHVDQWQARRRQLITSAGPLDMADEVEGELVNLAGHDWIDTAAAEAGGHYPRGVRSIEVDGLSSTAIEFHALHGPKIRADLEAQQLARLAESARRMRERDAEAAADRAARDEMERRMAEAAVDRRLERFEAAKVRPAFVVNRL